MLELLNIFYHDSANTLAIRHLDLFAYTEKFPPTQRIPSSLKFNRYQIDMFLGNLLAKCHCLGRKYPEAGIILESAINYQTFSMQYLGSQ